MSRTTLFPARRIVTLDPTLPEASHIAVRDGRILAVGGPDCAAPWGAFEIDDRLSDAVLLPGFVEGHAHLLAGAMWDFTYIGFQDRADPDGRLWAGLADTGAVVARLREALTALAADAPLIAWGFDPIFLDGERLNRRHLDAVATDRPVVVIHSNFHLMTVNSAGLALAGYDRGTDAEGVARFGDGEPSGELQEMAAMFPIFRRLALDISALARSERAVEAFARTALRAGVTTSTDLMNDLAEPDLERLLAVTGRPDFPLRLAPMLNGLSGPPREVAERAKALKARSTDRLRLGGVKVMTDGSIQGYTARLKWPGYVTGHPNGIWNTPPERLFELVDALHGAGIQMHIHTNGDEASEVALDALERAIARHGGGDIRHTLQHAQMAGPDQFRRMARLGICANLFANHLWFFGDAHFESTVGPERAHRIDACRSTRA